MFVTFVKNNLVILGIFCLDSLEIESLKSNANSINLRVTFIMIVVIAALSGGLNTHIQYFTHVRV